MITAEKAIEIAQRIIDKKGVTDEDLKQDIYLLAISKANKYESDIDGYRCIYSAIKFMIEKQRSIVKSSEESFEEKVIMLENTLDSIEDKVDLLVLKEFISEVMSTLTPKEQKLVSDLYGLNGKEEKTLTQIALENNVSRTRISDLRNRCLRKIRRRCCNSKNRKWLENYF